MLIIFDLMIDYELLFLLKFFLGKSWDLESFLKVIVKVGVFFIKVGFIFVVLLYVLF